MASTTAGQRSPDISYAGSAPRQLHHLLLAHCLCRQGRPRQSVEHLDRILLACRSCDELPPTSSKTSPTPTTRYGNITKIIDNSQTTAAGTTTYAYDPLNRLTGATTTQTVGGDYVQTYTYSAIGNITNKIDVGSYTYAGDQGANYANPHAVTPSPAQPTPTTRVATSPPTASAPTPGTTGTV